MRVYRGGRTEGKWNRTDEKSASEISAEWEPGRPLQFDATRNKEGSRHSDVGVLVDEHDIGALLKAVVNRDGVLDDKHLLAFGRMLDDAREQRISAKEADVQRLEQEIEALRKGLKSVSYLLQNWVGGAPSESELLEAVARLVRATLDPSSKNRRALRMKWINLDAL